MTITTSNIYSEVYSILKTFLTNRVTDPRNRFKANWIHPTLPDISDKGFDGFPFIVLSADVNSENRSTDIRIGERVFRVRMTLYSLDAVQLDTMCDTIFQDTNNNQLTDLRQLKSKQITSSPMDFFISNGKKIYRREIGMLAKLRL